MRNMNADGFLCFVPFILFLSSSLLPPGLPPQGQDTTTDINTYLSENLSGIKGHMQIFGREDEKMAEFREKSQRLARANREQIFVFRRVSSSGLHAVYLLDPRVFFYTRRHGASERRAVSGQTITGGTIVTFYMYVSKFFTPSRIWPSSSIGCSRRWPRRRRCSPSWTLHPKWWTPRRHRVGRGKGRNRSSATSGSASSGRVGAAGRVLPH